MLESLQQVSMVSYGLRAEKLATSSVLERIDEGQKHRAHKSVHSTHSVRATRIVEAVLFDEFYDRLDQCV